MKLELKHLAPYLPYGLQIARFDIDNNYKRIDDKLSCETIRDVIMYNNLKPILRPLIDLTKEIEYDGDIAPAIEFISTSNKDQEINIKKLSQMLYVRLSWWKIQRLLEMHFDVFGLIPEGLAMDINTL